MKTKLVLSILTIALIGLTACSKSDNKSETKEAVQKVALDWLAITDSGDYAKSWDASASELKKEIEKEDFEGVLNLVRKFLGAVESRNLKDAAYTTQLPEMPKGEYFVLKFETIFADKKQAVETVTLMQEKDGSWKVMGYFVEDSK